jgi:uncharacterized protein (DUF1778 family)
MVTAAERPTTRKPARVQIDALLDQRLFVMDAKKYDAFVSVLDNSPPAGPALKALMKRRPLWQG